MTDPRPESPAPLRVLVLDPDDRIRESLAGLLRIGGRCLVVGSAGRPDEALELAASMGPDVIVLDPRLPEMGGGTTFVTRLRAAAPGVRVLVLNWSDTGESMTPTSGADAYIRKTFRPRELIDAVVAAARPSVA